MMIEEDQDERQKGIENLIVLILGASDRKQLSMLHLEKESFLLWNFHPGIKAFIDFIKHYHGPYSVEIKETVEKPMYCIECWHYIRPGKGDRLTGGYVQLTQKGIREHNRLVRKLMKDPDLRQLFSAIKIVRRLYDELSPEELLLLIYSTYPEYIKMSDVYKEIASKRESLSYGLMKRGLIDQKRLESLVGR